jgi:peptidoglycan/LPS O-acetylase OafA/YrhL
MITTAPAGARAVSPARIPSLDGVRAAAILLVVFAHLCGTRAFLPESTLASTGDLGRRGVQMFFVLSGFLITSLLVEELQTTGWISLRAFYVRRAFRIFPAAYCYLAIMGVLAVAGVLPISAAGLCAAGTYTINYWGAGRTWYLGHLWSLAVEEQFYFLWPGVVALLGPGAARRVAAGAILFGACFRIVARLWLPGASVYWFPTVMDALAVGCLLALVRSDLECQARYMRFLRSRWGLVLILLTMAAIQIIRRPDALLSLPFSMAVGVLIHRVVTIPPAALNSRLAVWIGGISYSLYLWQQPFLFRDAAYSVFPLNLAAALAVAAASYGVFEKPLIRIGRRWSARIKERR